VYSSSNIIRIIKSGRMRSAGHWRNQKSMQSYDEKPLKGKAQLKDLGSMWENNIKIGVKIQ
jgi:hypothetical protein